METHVPPTQRGEQKSTPNLRPMLGKKHIAIIFVTPLRYNARYPSKICTISIQNNNIHLLALEVSKNCKRCVSYPAWGSNLVAAFASHDR